MGFEFEYRLGYPAHVLDAAILKARTQICARAHTFHLSSLVSQLLMLLHELNLLYCKLPPPRLLISLVLPGLDLHKPSAQNHMGLVYL